MLVDDVGRDGVEERAVVGDDEEGVGPGLEVVLEPVSYSYASVQRPRCPTRGSVPRQGVEIQVVRRLVEEEQVRLAEECWV